MEPDPTYAQIVTARRALRIPGYATLSDVGLDGPWTTPYHLAAKSADGPVLLTYNYLDAPSARQHREQLLITGYLPAMTFNRVLDLALAKAGMVRAVLYVTHAFHLLPASRSAAIRPEDVDISFDTVARHELVGRRVIALGYVASRVCARFGIAHMPTSHPSARGLSFDQRAAALADAFMTLRLTYPNA